MHASLCLEMLTDLSAPEDVGDQDDKLGGLLAHPLHPGLHRVLLHGPLCCSLESRPHESLNRCEPPLWTPPGFHCAP